MKTSVTHDSSEAKFYSFLQQTMKNSVFCHSQKQRWFRNNVVKKLLPLIVFSILPFLVNGQTVFRPGYYITWDNDTIFGLVDYRGAVRNSRFCSFKENDNAETIRLEPKEIQAYRFTNDKYYVSKEIEVEGEKKQIFLEMLVNGITNLYFLRYDEKDMYFLEKADGTIYTLVKDILTEYEKGKGMVSRETYKYVGQLKIAFADCWDILPMIKNVTLSHQSLIEMTKKYHDCVCNEERCIIYEKKLPALKVQIAPVVGMGMTTLKFHEGFFSKFENDNSISPVFGILSTFTLPRTNYKLSFEVEALFKEENLHVSFNNYYEVFINTRRIQPSLGIKYNFPKGKLRPTLSGGGFGSFLMNPNTRTTIMVDNIQTTKEDAYVPFVDKFFGLYLQLGCNYHILKNREAFTNLKITHGSAAYSSNAEKIRIKNSFGSVYFILGFYLGKSN